MDSLNPTASYLHDARGSLAYESAGQGDCVVLCHALGTDRNLWRNQFVALTLRGRVLSFDMRGHGDSLPALDADYSFKSLAADVISLMDHCGIASASLVGISVGGEMAQWVAANHPDRVKRLLLASTACFTTDARAKLWDVRIKDVLATGMEPTAAAAVRRWFSDEFRSRYPELVRAWERKIAATSVAAYAGIATAIQSMDLRPKIRGIACPTYVVCGDQDENTGPAVAATIADCIRGAELHIISGAGHFPNLERSVEFNDLLLRWLSLT
jgi:3-oxoadipate enol-lactonase